MFIRLWFSLGQAMLERATRVVSVDRVMLKSSTIESLNTVLKRSSVYGLE